MVSFVIDIGDPAVLQIGSIIWIVRDSRRTREKLVSIRHIAEDNAMEVSNTADSSTRNHTGVSDHVPSSSSVQHAAYRDNFLRPATYINQEVSLAHRRAIHVRRVAALRDLSPPPDTASGGQIPDHCATCPKRWQNSLDGILASV